MIVTVVDSMCGMGKTEAMLNMIKHDKLNGYVYITPYLTEIDRVIASVGENRIKQPDNMGKGKADSFNLLIREGHNVVSTHALFPDITKESIDLIKEYGYTLILDEVIGVVEHLYANKYDIEALLTCFLDIAEDGKATWKEEKKNYNKGGFSYWKNFADKNQLYFCNNQFFVWVFPVEIFNAFKDIYICTYLFDYQLQKYYYDLHNIEYQKVSVRNGKIIPYELQTDNLDKIHILEKHKINNIGDNMGTLSKTWYSDNINKDSSFSVLFKNNMVNFCRNIVRAKSKDVLWTSFKDFHSYISAKGFRKSYLVSNARATNEYMDRHCIMYCINKFLQPFVIKYFTSKDVYIDEDKYALSELIQFIYRSAVRNGEDVYCYIPSKRMRTLLIDFIEKNTRSEEDK